MQKLFWLQLLCRLFYVGAGLQVILFLFLLLTGRRPGTEWRFDLLLGALVLGFFGLLGDVVGDIAGNVRRGR